MILIILETIMIVLCMLVIYSIIRNLLKRKNLGKVLMKVRHGLQIIMGIAFISAAAIAVSYFTVYAVQKYSAIDYYGPLDIIRVIVNCVFYLSLYLKFIIGLLTGGEIRENGVVLFNHVIDYSDIRGLHWLDENKLLIKFDPNVSYISTRQFKEKWKVRDEQKAELEKYFEEKYYESPVG